MSKFGVVEFVAIFGAVAAVAAILAPNYVRSSSRGGFTACISNVKNIGAALEMYSTDWSGSFPPTLSNLTPNYLKTIPSCPAAGADTYSTGYRNVLLPCKEITCPTHSSNESQLCADKRESVRSRFDLGSKPSPELMSEMVCPDGAPYTLVSHVESYQFHCHGENHVSVSLPANYPQYDGVQGLIER